MNLNVDISPDDERMLNDILDDGISELKDNNTLRKSEKEESRANKYYINDNYNSKLQKSSVNFNQSINFKENTGEKTAKSSALRNLLNEIKSDQSSPSSSKSPAKINYSTKANTLIDSQKMSNFGRLRESSSTSREVNFGDMKSDIRSLQDKILGLERKLFNKNPNVERSGIVSDTEEKQRPVRDITSNEKPAKLNETVGTNDKINKTSDSVKIKVRKSSVTNLKLKNKASLSNVQIQYQNSLFQSFLQRKDIEAITRNAKSINNNSISTDNSKNGSTIKSSKDLKDMNNYSYRNTVKEWKEKYYKSLKEHEVTKCMLIKEKQKNHDLNKTIKNLERKSANFDNLNYRLNKLVDDHEKLLSQYEQSEIIRREQSKLIKTLQNEVSILRRYDNNSNILSNIGILNNDN